MRLRLPELLEAADLTPYAVHKLSAGRISLSTIYRLVRQRGEVASFDAQLLDALCDLLHIQPGELFEREQSKAVRPGHVSRSRSTSAAARRRVR